MNNKLTTIRRKTLKEFFKENWKIVLGVLLGLIFGFLLGMDTTLTMVDKGIVPPPGLERRK